LLVNRLKTCIFFVNVPLKLLSPEALFSPICIKYRLAAWLRPDPLGELTALPRPQIDLSGLFLGGGEEQKNEGGDRRGRKGAERVGEGAIMRQWP